MSASPSTDVFLDSLIADMRSRWEAGERPLTEDYLAKHPSLRNHPGAIGELIYEEVCLRRERGQSGCSTEVLKRFPQWANQLRVLLEVRDTLELDADPDYPSSGDVVCEFQLMSELGRGRRGRVFLARQIPLAERLVVVKLTPRQGVSEHHTLARLQHTNIVPLYAVLDDDNRSLRILCMPYFPGATLAAAFEQLKDIPTCDRTPLLLRQAVVARSPNDLRTGEDSEPLSWGDDGYVNAVCRIGACLAEALQFAHDRHFIHMDVKPSNILLTSDGQPMLLDFHLAREPLPEGAIPPATLGGSVGYLSPEQSAAFEAVKAGHPLRQHVDGRSDLFSLGVVLYEALAGQQPGENPRPLVQLNPRVSPGLSDIVARCLAPRPKDRYPTALALAEDLRAHLANRPLRGVRNRSLAERWRKWRRRRPHALGMYAVLLLMMFTSLYALAYITARGRQGERALIQGEEELVRGNIAVARGTFLRGLTAAEELPLHNRLVADLREGLWRAERAELAGELHTVAQGLRGLSFADSVSAEAMIASEQSVRRLWEKREQLFGLAAADLPNAIRRQAREDLFDLAILWSQLKVRISPSSGVVDAKREALQVLKDTEAELGSTPALCLERAILAESLGLASEASAARFLASRASVKTAWEHAALGNFYFRSDRNRARTEFEQAVEIDPHSYWAQLAFGRCEMALGSLDESLIAFSVCIGLEPKNAQGYLHRGLVNAKLKRREVAIKDIERALELDPTNLQAKEMLEQVKRSQ